MDICTVSKLFTAIGATERYWTDTYEYGRTIRVNNARERYMLIERSRMDEDLRVNISLWDDWHDMIYFLQQKLQRTCQDFNKVTISTDQAIWHGLMSVWPYVKNYLSPLPHE